MMIFFLILGVALGAVSIIFILQNVEPVTVAFFSMSLSGSMALILFLALFSGVIITVLILLPSFIRDAFALSRLRKQNKQLEDDLAAARESVRGAATHPTPVTENIAEL